MMFHGIPWGSMRFYDVLVNRSVPMDANRDLTSYTLRISSGHPKALINELALAAVQLINTTPIKSLG
jgi:hypothetical protein